MIDKSVVSSSLSEPDRLAVVVVDKTNPKLDIVSMFSTERGEQNLQQILQQQIDWHRGIEFLVRISVIWQTDFLIIASGYN